jgi:uncharacterized protein YkwD
MQPLETLTERFVKNRFLWLCNLCVVSALLALSCSPRVAQEQGSPKQGPTEATGGPPSGSSEASKPDTQQSPTGQTAKPKPGENHPAEPLTTAPATQNPTTQAPAAQTVTAPTPPPPTAQTPQLPEPQPLPPEPPVLPHKYPDLARFMLDLINRDRTANGLDPVVLGGNAASQKHAEENLANSYTSHWGTDGSKPYMRYTAAGGVNYVLENVIGTGASGGPAGARDPKGMLTEAEQHFMDSPLHRATILYEWNKKVSLGIAFTDNSLSVIQHFEGDYVGFSQTPVITGTVISMAGKLKAGSLQEVAIHYDPLPQPLTAEQLNAPPYDSTYSLGQQIGSIISPPPAGAVYTNLGPGDTVATTWDVRPEGWFTVRADISKLLAGGSGVYTVAVLADMNGRLVRVSNYSVFAE